MSNIFTGKLCFYHTMLFSLLLAGWLALPDAQAQTRRITGEVTSAETGTPLPGVNVVLKGTTTGTITNADGVYSLQVPGGGGTLEFSFIGLITKEMEIGNQSVIDMAMAEDVKQLNEVVYVGYGT